MSRPRYRGGAHSQTHGLFLAAFPPGCPVLAGWARIDPAFRAGPAPCGLGEEQLPLCRALSLGAGAELCVPSPGALVHLLHRPAAALPALEHLQRGDQAEHVSRHQLPQPGLHHPPHQLQQLQAAHEQQGLDLRQVRAGAGGQPRVPCWHSLGAAGAAVRSRMGLVPPPPRSLSVSPRGRSQPSLTPYLRRRCRQCASMCAVCHHVVKGLFVWCQGCSHGGHLQHIMKWLETSSHCPAGCGHLCEYT